MGGPRVRLAAAVAAGVLVGATLGGVAVASHQFGDVPDESAFHDDISWMAENDITTGYADGTFRPGEPVSRQAMAAFMHRLASSYEWVHSSSNPGSGNIFSHGTTCPDGRMALGGAGEAEPTIVQVISERPTFGQGGAVGWSVTWSAAVGGNVDPSLLRVWVLCGPTP